MLRPTRLALAGAIILWRFLRVIFWRVLGDVFCRGPKGSQASHPSLPLSGSAHLGAHAWPPLWSPHLGLPYWIAPSTSPPTPPHSLLRPKTDPWAWAHLLASGPRPLGPRPWPWLLREFRAPPTPTGAQLRALGSYPAVGGPHRHLPPGPRHLRTRPRLPAAARGLGAAPLLPCSAVSIRLSETGVRRVRGPRIDHVLRAEVQALPCRFGSCRSYVMA